ncbi:Aspyridones efflux protein apdF [Colletotrichum shisoi]|uniref:Aspyridones efflux protein apdF n=1 Tax=Colletotrichum shisoi TaxID=2078593 RepID=A0A5Q4BH29_9PEZI|nr:Aspyridones efflux protein apdF [Colletotrichum shisoi]
MSCCSGHFYDIHQQDPLAGSPCSGALCRTWKWVVADTHDGCDCHVLWKEAASCLWNCGVRECDRRPCVPIHGKDTVTLLPTVGFGWTMRAVGFHKTGNAGYRSVLDQAKTGAEKTWQLFGLDCFSGNRAQSFRSRVFHVFRGGFFGSFFFFLSSYPRENQGMPYTESVNLLLILNGVGFAARMLPSLLARYFGTVNTFFALLFGSQMAMFTWIAVDSTSGLDVWTVYYSLVIGGVQSLAPAAASSCSPDLQKLGSLMGMVLDAIGVGALIGSPIAGVLVSALEGSYVGAQAVAGTSIAVGCALVFAAKEVARRKKNASLWTKM